MPLNISIKFLNIKTANKTAVEKSIKIVPSVARMYDGVISL